MALDGSATAKAPKEDKHPTRKARLAGADPSGIADTTVRVALLGRLHDADDGRVLENDNPIVTSDSNTSVDAQRIMVNRCFVAFAGKCCCSSW